MHYKEYRPTLAQLRTFVTIAENKHFGAAASKLRISQPSLSQALVALETGLGVQLIERSTRKVIVTPIGQTLLPYARKTLEAADTFLAQSHGVNGTLSGPLNIGIIPTIAPYLLPYLIPLINSQFPEIELHVVEEQTEHLLESLRDGRVDVALMALPSESAGVVDMPLYDEPFIVVVPSDHHYAGRSNLTLDALDNLDLLLLDEGHCLHDQIVDLCRRADAHPSHAAAAVSRAASLTTLMELVVGRLGSTLVPLSAVNAECQRRGLATATFEESVHASRQVGLAYRASSSRIADFNALAQLVTRSYETAAAKGRKALDN